jgi:UDP-glucose:(heptosyl)LPS alpha-1,3-glucosyltransferase
VTLPKIALIKQSMGLMGGLEKQTFALARGFVRRGYEVDLICQNLCATNLQGVNVVLVGSPQYNSWLSLINFERGLKKHLLNQSYHLILGLERHSLQTHYRAGGGVHRYYLQKRIKSAHFLKKISLYLNPLHHFILKLEAQTFGPEGAKRIYANSYFVKQQIIDFYKCDPERIKVIHNGVEWLKNSSSFEQSEILRTSICHNYHLDPQCRFLLFIGSGYERKGLLTALHSLAQAQSEFHLIVIGKERHATIYQQYAAHLGLKHRIHWLGYQNQTLNFYQICEALVLPTFYDPFANVTLEALAMGLFVLTTFDNGASEILTPDSGLILNPLHHSQWALAYENLWKTPCNFSKKNLIRQTVKDLEAESQIDKLIEDALAIC